MTDQELIEIKNYLIQNSQQVSDIPEVDSTFGVSSIPAIKIQSGQDDQVVRVPITLLSPQLRMNGQILQYKNPDGQWVNIYDFSTITTGGGGTFSGTYKNNNKIIQKLGALQKGLDTSSGIDYTELFNKIFFPNYNNEFPSNPIFFGKSDSVPNSNLILSLSNPIDYYQFDYNDFMDKDYFVIALPGQFYLKRIEDSNGMNVVGCFDLTYKSIQTQNINDIYNVYISPKLDYDENLELTFTTKKGEPVQSTLNGAQFYIDDVTPNINSIYIKEAIKSVIKSIKIGVRDIQPLLNNISITYKTEILLDGLSIKNRDVNVTIGPIAIKEGVRCILNNIKVEQAYYSIINSLSINEATKSIINNIQIKEGSSILNNISIKEATKSIINNISIKQADYSVLNSISIKEGKSLLNSIQIKEATKSILNSISIKEATKSVINNLSIKPGTSVLTSISIKDAVKAILNYITIKVQ